jgi:vanillate O-demethylase monooxygenase subunit
MAVIERAFAEDRAMIEAQQEVIANTPKTRMLQLASDGALNQFRRLMVGLIEAERRPNLVEPEGASHAVA